MFNCILDKAVNYRHLLSESEVKIQNKAHNFCQQQFSKEIDSCFKNEIFPIHWVKELAENGFVAPNLNPSFNYNETSYGLCLQELERVDSALRTFCSVQGSLVIYPIFSFGSEEQKKTWLPPLFTGDCIGSFALTEPHGGSDPASMKTVAKKVKSGYQISGIKKWVSNGFFSNLIIVWAKLENEVRAFVVPKNTKGVEHKLIKNKYSLNAMPSSEFTFRSCFVDSSALLENAIGLSSALKCLNQARYGIAWGAIGAAMDCLEHTLKHAQTRLLFKNPMIQFQNVQFNFSHMIQALALAQVFNIHLSRLKQDNKLTPIQVSIAKANHVKQALKSARLCRDLLGANGILLDEKVIRHMLNLESVSTYEGTDSIHNSIIGSYLAKSI